MAAPGPDPRNLTRWIVAPPGGPKASGPPAPPPSGDDCFCCDGDSSVPSSLDAVPWVKPGYALTRLRPMPAHHVESFVVRSDLRWAHPKLARTGTSR